MANILRLKRGFLRLKCLSISSLICNFETLRTCCLLSFNNILPSPVKFKKITGLAMAALSGLWGCSSPADNGKKNTAIAADSSIIFRFTDKGDSLYALKKDYSSFEQAMVYYDSAAQLAENTQDIAVKGYVAFSKASVYNAWNKEPDKTISLFKEAAGIYSKGKDKESLRRFYYCSSLIAHAYDNEKGKDSANCIHTLRAIQDSLKHLPHKVWKNWHFVNDLAWIATNANDYTLAESLLADFTERKRIINDPETNNYLDHYYLTRARIDVFKYKNMESPYLDSLQVVFKNANLNFEKLYYGQNLAKLYAASGNYKNAYSVVLENELASSAVNDSAGIGSLKNRLLKTQLESEKKDGVLRQAQHRNRMRLLWLLGGGLGVISFFSYRFFRGQQKYRMQSARLEQANYLLDEKMKEVDLISKEMQHRIKNNLQMIQSLVYMQQRNTDSKEVRENMQQMGLRIESIASLHQQLSGKETGMIDLKSYVSGMLTKVVELVDRNKKIITHFDIENMELSARYCLPLGLILNEWITNSIKYAQVSGGSLSIYIQIKKTDLGLLIEYYDSGSPVACADFTRGLGLTLIELLKVQLKASIEQKTENCFFYRMFIEGYGK